MKLITEYYRRERAKGREGVHRRDLETFLRHAPGELDRAQIKTNGSRALEWEILKGVMVVETGEVN